MLKKLFFLALMFFLQICNAEALTFSKRAELVNLKITPEYKAVSPETGVMDIIAEADIDRGWHLYWDNPGDTGEPTTLSFYESPYYREISGTHSAPQKSVFEDIITSYVYTEKVYFRTSFKLQNISGLKRLPFNLVFSYTACSGSCQPEDIAVSFALPVAATAEKNPSYPNALIQAEPTFPIRLEATAAPAEQNIEIKLQQQILKDCGEAEFVSRHPKKGPLSPLPKTTVAAHDRLQVSFSGEELPPDMNGIILCPGHVYYLEPVFSRDTFIQNNSAKNATTAEKNPSAARNARSNSTSGSLLYYMLTAFIAGLILNLMPCVLPILSLKALYLVQNNRRSSPLSALSYTAGVICSFWILAGILFALREIGAGAGWGFQLQSPVFNIFLLLLFFLIFLNLTDKLPLPGAFADKLSRAAGGKSFLTGFFAVVIACPCTGPFMGAALGYALSEPAEIYFGIFLSLGLGYALPYALVEIFPAVLLRHIPKPGHWMITLKRILALPILLTCFWLGWVIFNQLRPQPASSALSWEPYTPAKVDAALAENRPVFVNFTAKWCLVCLLNDKTSLSSAAFYDTVRSQNIRLFKADWTSRSEDIRLALQNYGRNSIPLYVYYPAGQKQPVLLPQILTPEILQKSLR